jgi:hypothetical protein
MVIIHIVQVVIVSVVRTLSRPGDHKQALGRERFSRIKSGWRLQQKKYGGGKWNLKELKN